MAVEPFDVKGGSEEGMLFDLRGKRRRVVKATYLTLAILMGSSLVLFGIGSDATGGLLDAVGIGGHGGSGGHGGGGGSVDFEDRAEEIEDQLADDPRDERLLLRLAEARYQAGTNAADTDDGGGHGGTTTLTEESVEQFRESVAAWERYIDIDPRRPNPDTATIVVQAYAGLNDVAGAARVQEIVVDDAPSQGAFANLALYRYASGDMRRGDQARDRAVAAAPKSQRQSVRSQLEQVRRQARSAQSQGGAAGSQLSQP